MAKQTLVFESVKNLSVNNDMIVITYKESGVMSSDGQEHNTYHSLHPRRKKRITYGKPLHVEFF